MKIRHKIAVLMISAVLGAAVASAMRFDDESLDYKVNYKWGLIHKQAGHATLSLRNEGT